MKKILLVVLSLIALNCEFSCQEAKADESWVKQIDEIHDYTRIQYVIKEIDGMRYIIASNDASYSSPFFVNLTKDSLETELLRLEIEQLKSLR
jgi:hypothetical protein